MSINIFKQIRTTNTENGFRHLISRIYYFILRQFIDIGYTYKIYLDKIENIPPLKEFTFEVMNISDIDTIFHTYPKEINEQTYLELTGKLHDSNYDGYIIKKEREVCGFCFINYKISYPILKNQYVDNKFNGYLCYDYVFKKYRNQKIHQYEIYNRLQLLKKKNYRTATALVNKYNYPARRAYEKLGFKKCVMSYNFQFIRWMKSTMKYKILNNKN
jgi:ribosomal protein S18 acetylase RimI-like enzyme